MSILGGENYEIYLYLVESNSQAIQMTVQLATGQPLF